MSTKLYRSGNEEFELPVVASDGEPEVSEEEEEIKKHDPIKTRKESIPLVVSDPDLTRIYSEMSANEESEDEKDLEETESLIEQDLSESSDIEEELDSDDLRELQRRKRESDEENFGLELLSSLDDIKTDEEMEDINSTNNIQNEEVDAPHVEDWAYEPEDFMKKTKIRKKLPKDSEDSEGTEYESIKSGDEEHIKDSVSRKTYEPLVFEIPNKDKFEIFEDFIDEYDNNFNIDFNTRYISSASSSSRESDFDNDSCKDKDPQFTLIPVKPKFGKKKKAKAKEKDDSGLPKTLKKGKLEVFNYDNIEMLKSLFPMTQTPFVYEINLQKYESVQFPQHCKNQENKNEDKIQHEKIVIKTEKKKEKKVHLLQSRKRRNLIYNRLHGGHNNNADETDSGPDDEIPSYKAKMTYTRGRSKTVGTVLDIILNQTFGAIEKIELAKERKRVPYFAKYLIQEICYKIVYDVENKQKAEAVKYNIEVLLDCWEYEILEKKKNIINNRFNEISELIVTNEINNAVSFLHYEDYVCACLVRDAFAESLISLKVPQKKIKQKIDSIFFQYHLPKYNFENNDRVRKRKKRVHREQKTLVNVKNTNNESKKVRKILNRLTFMKSIVFDIINGKEFSDKLLRNNKIIFSVNDVNKVSASGNSLNQSLVPIEVCVVDESENPDDRDQDDRQIPVPLKTTDVAEKFRQVKVRLGVLDVWQQESVRLNAMVRRKSWLFNKINNEEETFFDKDEVDVNLLYENAEKEEKEEKEVELLDPDVLDEADLIEKKLELPRIEEEVKLALRTSLLPVVINPVKPRLKCVIENQPYSKNEGNGLEINYNNNDKMDISKIKPDTPVKSTEKNRRETIESGFFSCNDDNDSNNECNSFFEPCVVENENNLKDIVKQIPAFDRDYYLNQWIVHGVNPSLPSASTTNSKPNRRFHKRPVSAETVNNFIEVIPNNQMCQRFQGRLNSASSNRSGVSSRCFSGRSTSMSAVEYDKSDSEETINNASPLNKKQINTKIEFTIPEKPSDDKNKNETAAWDFYLNRKQNKRHLEQYEAILKGVNIEGSELYVNEKLLLLNEEKEVILKNFSKTLLSYSSKNDNEKEIELLRPPRPPEIKDNKFDDDVKHLESDVEIERTITPWKPLKNRPHTPDSVDSDEEVKKMKNIYIETINKNKTFDEEKQNKALLLEMKRKQLDVARSAWKKPSSKNPMKEALEANRELFLKLEINLKNSLPKRPEHVKRFSIAESEGISRRIIEKQKEKNDIAPPLNIRAKSTPKSVSNYKNDSFLPSIPKTPSIIGSSENYSKRKISIRNSKSPQSETKSKSPQSETKSKSPLSFTKSKSSLSTIDAKNHSLLVTNGSKTLR